MTEKIDNLQRAKILTQALPYIRKYNGRIVVIKYGGNAMVSEELKHEVMEDIVLLWLIGVKVVLVHGGGPDITDMMEKLGMEPVQFFKGGWAMALVILIFVWKNCVYNIILFSAGLKKIPKDVREFARLDGANHFQVITRIVVPLLRPTTFFVILLTVISSFKIFREVYLLYGMYPDENVYMIQHFMNNNFNNLNYPRLSTASIILSIVIIAAMLLLFLYEKRGTE